MAKSKIKKGSVLVQTSKGVYPYSVLQKAEMDTSSQQLKQKSKWQTENDLIPRPYPPESFLLLYESNPVFWRCVVQVASDVAGIGWSLQLLPDKKEDKTELKRINAFLDKPNSEDSLRLILKQLIIDWGSIGDFGLEVVRNNKGDIAEVYHVPAHTIRVHKSKKKYCQIRNNKKVWFKRFGITKDISSKDGKEGKHTVRTRANELIFYKNFYPKSDYYGAPNVLAAAGAVVGLIGLRDYNLAFFENYGIPSALIVLEGEWEGGSKEKVMQFLNKELKGAEKQHRTLVVQQPEECKFVYTPLSTETKEGSFKIYEQMRREDIMIAYSMPPERIGIRVVGKLGGNVAEEANKIYVQSVVEPLQLDIEDILNQKLIQSETYQLKFKNIDLRNYETESKRMGSEIERGVRTPNEARRELGLKSYPEGDKFYMMSSLIDAGESDEPLSK